MIVVAGVREVDGKRLPAAALIALDNHGPAGAAGSGGVMPRARMRVSRIHRMSAQASDRARLSGQLPELAVRASWLTLEPMRPIAPRSRASSCSLTEGRRA